MKDFIKEFDNYTVADWFLFFAVIVAAVLLFIAILALIIIIGG